MSRYHRRTVSLRRKVLRGQPALQHVENRFRKDVAKEKEDALLQCDDVLGEDDVACEDCQENQHEETQEGENILPDGRAAFNHQRLEDRGEGGFANVFVTEDGHPFGGAGLILCGEGNVVQVPLVVIYDSIQADGKVRNEHMF
jgi:hypothetical protein